MAGMYLYVLNWMECFVWYPDNLLSVKKLHVVFTLTECRRSMITTIETTLLSSHEVLFSGCAKKFRQKIKFDNYIPNAENFGSVCLVVQKKTSYSQCKKNFSSPSVWFSNWVLQAWRIIIIIHTFNMSLCSTKLFIWNWLDEIRMKLDEIDQNFSL